MIKREHYLNQIIDLIDKDIIKILTGVRRSGKSVLLQQVVNHLKNNGIKEENIIFIDLESPDFLSYSTINDLNEYIKSKSNKTDKYYLFFDEIQRIEGWQRLVNAYFSLDNFDVYVTGSNSKLLSGEFATYLTGRYINIKIFIQTAQESGWEGLQGGWKVKGINKTKKGCMAILSCALVLPLLSLPSTNAALGIETTESTGRTCSLTLTDGSEYTDLKAVEIPVELYKVATVDVSGNYTLTSDFTGLTLPDQTADKAVIDEQWKDTAEDAAALADGKTADSEMTLLNGTATVDSLSTGLYLIVPETVIGEGAINEYNFAPSLISLPNNNYASTGNGIVYLIFAIFGFIHNGKPPI